MVITVTVEGLEYVKLADYNAAVKAHSKATNMLFRLASMTGQQKFDAKEYDDDHFGAVRNCIHKLRETEAQVLTLWKMNKISKFEGDELSTEAWTEFFIASFPSMAHGRVHVEKVLRMIVNAVLDRFVKDASALKKDAQFAKGRYENLRKLTRLLAAEAFGEENG